MEQMNGINGLVLEDGINEVLVAMYKLSEWCYEWDDEENDYVDEDMGWLSCFVFNAMVIKYGTCDRDLYVCEGMEQPGCPDKDMLFRIQRVVINEWNFMAGLNMVASDVEYYEILRDLDERMEKMLGTLDVE